MNSCSGLSDKELVSLLKRGNVMAFTTLYNKYSQKIYVNMFRMVKDREAVEEMIQILFSRIWQQREVITYEFDFSSYLYRASSNLVCDFYRKLESDKKMRARFKATVMEQYSHIEEDLYFKESKALLEQALASLSPQQRRVYQLCKIEGFSYKETAGEMGISPYTVKEYLCTAKRVVRTFITNNMETAGSFITILFLLSSVIVWTT